MGNSHFFNEYAIHSHNYALRTTEQLLCGIIMLTFQLSKPKVSLLQSGGSLPYSQDTHWALS